MDRARHLVRIVVALLEAVPHLADAVPRRVVLAMQTLDPPLHVLRQRLVGPIHAEEAGVRARGRHLHRQEDPDRQSVVMGKSVSVRVEYGGRSSLQKTLTDK